MEGGLLRRELNRLLAGVARLCQATEFPECTAEIFICLSEFGIDDQRLSVLGHRLVPMTLVSNRFPKIYVSLHVVRSKFQPLPTPPPRLVQFALLSKHVAEIAVCLREFRLQRQRPPVVCDCFVQLALLSQSNAEIVVRLG